MEYQEIAYVYDVRDGILRERNEVGIAVFFFIWVLCGHCIQVPEFDVARNERIFLSYDNNDILPFRSDG